MGKIAFTQILIKYIYLANFFFISNYICKIRDKIVISEFIVSTTTIHLIGEETIFC